MMITEDKYYSFSSSDLPIESEKEFELILFWMEIELKLEEK